MKLDFRQRLLASTLLVGASVLAASPAFAQDTGQSTVPDQNQATNPGAAPPTGSQRRRAKASVFALEFRPSLVVSTLGGGADSVQGTAVAKLIQRIDNLPVTKRQALPASPRFTYQMQ